VLLAYLALSPDMSRARAESSRPFCGAMQPTRAATDNLRVCVFNLRKALGEGASRVIASDGRDLALDPQPSKWTP
jgi:DNA-binding SARP family transcriptional activator